VNAQHLGALSQPPLALLVVWVALGAASLLLFANAVAWQVLARRCRSAEGCAQSLRLRFASSSVGFVGWFPLSYPGCTTVSVSAAGLCMSVPFPFRLVAPPISLPWSQVQSVAVERWALVQRTVLRVRGTRAKLAFAGEVASSIASAYSEAQSQNVL
jgi:hypothetical protein